jgi:hypothetical protein
MGKEQRRRVKQEGGAPVAIYHRVYASEGFDEAAQTLFRLVQQSQSTSPGAERLLYIDIDGHRNEAGGFDSDMFELQQHFVLGFLMQFLTEVNMPLAPSVRRKADSPQSNDIPEALTIQKPDEQREG